MEEKTGDRGPAPKPHGCLLAIAWFVGFVCGLIALQLVQHVLFPLPQPMPEELRMDGLHMLAILFVCVCSGFLGVWFTWRVWKFL